ncbi:hypothetical protein [Rhizorhabdus sp.]|uniref:hypothetical protein n=1 Tax=Rhizorhabdus sp. TaxID=1968843 RepID=UPI00198A194B|nr:hypothetical protein [Rhizorhabdus sp.]MBD3762833.1 hypothetical protein [Rhizorhabdus sp.]
MHRSLLSGLMLLTLSACGKEAAKAPEADSSGPQIATSIEDYALPVDKSDQITAIDAATGDAGGMPRDGGAVVRIAKPEAHESVETDGGNAAAPVAAPPPLVVPQPVTPAAAPPTAAPAPGA